MRSSLCSLSTRFKPLRALLALSVLSSVASAGSLAVTARDQDSAPIAELVVWLTPVDGKLPPLPAAGSLQAVVEQKDEEFNPYIIAVRTGTEVRFPNLDDVQHHVYSLSRPAKFDIPLHGGNITESIVLDHAGLVPVGCNIHDWMLSYVVVIDSPWFAQTTAAGMVTLADLPPGDYQLEAWNPRLRQTHQQAITLSDGPNSVALELRLRPDRRIRRAPTSGSKGY
jgi:plastocyanin